MKRSLLVVLGAVIGFFGSAMILKLFYLWYMPRYDTGFDHQTRQVLIVTFTVPLCALLGAVAAWWKTRPKR